MVKTVVIFALVAALVFGLMSYGHRSTSEKISDAAAAVGDDIKDAADDAEDAVKDASN